MKASTALIASFAALTAATPTPTLQKRADICGQWDTVQTGTYTLYQDLWGEDAGTGSQCSGVDSVSGSTIAWHTTWNWSGGSSSVKSFANAVGSISVEQISQISTIPTTWSWSYAGSDIVADVAYDMFTSSTATGDDEYEIMVWLAALGGAGPISSTGSAIATPTIAGHTWNLYYGLNGSMKVYSFVVSGSSASDFSGDLLDFYTYLVSDQAFPSSQYLKSIGAGTEPFTGSNAELTTTAYSVTLS